MDTHSLPASIRTASYCRVAVVYLDGKGGVASIATSSPLPDALGLVEGKVLPPGVRGMVAGGWRIIGEGWLAQAEGRGEVEFLLLRSVRAADELLGPYGECPVNEEMVRMLLDNPYEGLTAVDGEGRVTYLSPSNEKWFGLQPGGAKGLLLADLSPTSRLPEVAKSGKAERAQVLDLHGSTKVTVNLPVKRSDRVVGAFGRILFQSPAQVEELAGRVRSMELQVERYETLLDELRGKGWTFADILTNDPAMLHLLGQARRVADSSATVLILGESGTGKELVAQALHQASRRRRGPFIAVNCAAIPNDLIESELFGYEEGAFSGAKRRGKPGKFELATGGTLFLDEVGELPPDSQAKLLRAIEERTVERLGSTSPVKVDFRLIAATNRDPGEMAAKGKFRSDLYYRLHEIPIEIPPLRARREDIPLLAVHFLEDVCKRERLPPKKLSAAAMEALKLYGWPGNVRELRSVIRRLAWQTGELLIDHRHLPPAFGRAESMESPGALSIQLARAEREAVEAALARSDGNRAKAARALGIHRTALYKKCGGSQGLGLMVTGILMGKMT